MQVSIVQRLHAEGVHQPLVVALQRADYLVHCDPQRAQHGMQLKQVKRRENAKIIIAFFNELQILGVTLAY